MKHIYTIFLFFIYSSGFAQDFEKNWDKVIQLENEGKIKSANAIVTKIQSKATSTKNEVQLIKTFFYTSKYMLTLEEDAQRKVITNLQKRISKAPIATKAILNLIYARCLKSYLDENQNKVYSRTKRDTIEIKDFITWSLNDFESQIDSAYKNTLKKVEVLKKTPLNQYEPIFDYFLIEKFNNATLYDYLIQANIDHYIQKANQWEMPNFQLSKYNMNLLGTNEEFNSLKLDSIKSRSVSKVLLLFQKAHLKNTPSELELDRLLFCNKYIIRKDYALLKRLDNLQKQSKDTYLTQKIQLEKAILYKNLASKKDSKNYNAKAITILDSIIAIQNKSNAVKNAIHQKNWIISKELDLNMLQYTYEKEKTRALIRFKNVDSIQISFYKVNSKIFHIDFTNDSIAASYKSKNKKYIAQKYYLPNQKDYFNYSTEVLLPELELGNYIVLIEDLGETKSKLTYRKITVTNTTLLNYQNDNKLYFQTIHRKTGHPIANCQIKSDDFNLKTNDKGIAFFQLDLQKKDYKFQDKKIVVIHQNDTIQVLGNYIRNYYTDYESEIEAKVNFYIDRAIYRPGQTVYFKGIATQMLYNEQRILPNFLVKVIVEDANGDEFKSFELTTNEFGSFVGEFVLPKNGLTGQYSLSIEEPDDYEKDALYNSLLEEHPIWDNGEMNDSYNYFSVEEYKRPKFETKFEPVTETYTVKQKIKVVGIAKAFAGSKISDAKVTYTVERKSFNNWKDDWSNDEETLVSSETKTDADGKFNIEFEAIPAKDYTKENLPIFSYVITADVTDNNGETHSANTIVKVGYHTLNLDAILPYFVNSNEKESIVINSTNLNNQFVPVEGEIKIYYQKAFHNKFKKRVFSQPEIKSISDSDFEKLFPYENNEEATEKNTNGILVYTKKTNTAKEKSVPLNFISNYKSGHYKVVFSSNDKFNNPIETSTDFLLFQKKANNFPENSLVTIEQLNENTIKDGFAKILIKTALPELNLSVSAHFKDSLIYENNITVKNHQQEIRIPIASYVRKGFKLTLENIFENQYFKTDKIIVLKEDVPKISFEIESFRSKLEPGKEENWSFKIKENNAKIEAEVLASMYDASLDQFKTTQWSNLKNNERIYHNYYGKTELSSGMEYFRLNYSNQNNKRFEYQNERTQLMWFGFDINNTNSPSVLKEYQKQITKKAKKPANSKLITGIVSDRIGPLPGASIVVKGTNRSTQADFDGYYEIEAAFGEVLTVSFTGYNNRIVTVNTNEINVKLIDGMTLDEVVVEGYFSTKKAHTTVAQTTINSEIIENYPNTSFIQTLQGQIAGLNITSGSGSPGSGSSIVIRGIGSITANSEPLYVVDGVPITREEFLKLNPNDIAEAKVLKDAAATAIFGNRGSNGVIIISTKKTIEDLTKIKTRTNRNETAFFFPQIRTDKEGKISFKFNAPEELTEWKFRLLAHNKKALSGYLEKSVVTQKELMVFPNMPRFFRENDTIVISAKVANLTSELKTGMAILQLFDATTMENIDAKTMNSNAFRNFTITPSGNSVVSWKITIPQGLQGLQYKVIAKAGNYSDGEESALPVLTNNILVTETIPVWMREHSKKEYVLTNLKNNTSTTLRHHLFTLEYTSNPTWIAIQSLPYLMEYEHDCAEQLFSKYYANVLASEIINSNPKIASVFEQWKKSGKPISKLEQNEELKSLLLAETPWINDAQSEEEKKKNMATLFDLEKTKSNEEAILKKLKEKQKPSGGFAWFEDGNENEYITRHIVSGLGHLQKLKIKKETIDSFTEITKKAIDYLDSKYLDNNSISKDYKIWNTQYADLHYLYMRTFYLESNPMNEKAKAIATKQLEVVKTDWLTYSIYNKGLAAMILNRFGDKNTAKKIIESLKETSATNEDSGMYWIENKAGWYWYQSPIETQTLLIEAFTEITDDNKSIDAMKVWLLKNKQTKSWNTTKATTEAIYALLYQGSDWLSVKDNTKIKIGNNKILTSKLAENEKEAETGYVKMNWKADEISNDMANISFENNSKVPNYGGIYWQYFEDLDQIKSSDKAAMTVAKELYLKKNTNNGQQLEKITSKNPLKIGDLITVRLVIETKEDMEFIHLKDMRASCFEPVDVLSKYEWKERTSYYKSTKDAATHFFFDNLNKGTYVIEYDIRVNNKGDFSNGITSIESMYAPEFTSHTKGIRINVSE
ncbi:MG2 domain-containing protein [Flavobacterium sp. UBA7682]|uniref:alpha-2-macroglobulin family protein n=1 Tax=Flavobacterium sp. UBA7682 TaxID=1946560 RepID=UPI0025B99C88|nr:MG2 domain-containing protein [Flavobacterium sp. UBA7682]